MRTWSLSRISHKAVLVNRNLTQTNAELHISASSSNRNNNGFSMMFGGNGPQINYTINPDRQAMSGGFVVSFDDYELFWKEKGVYDNNVTQLDAKQIADIIWTKWLESVGIL
ncbi:hypothetical protein [Chitinophaga pinensis]|uniref:Uncharacterized protein n=1 Tax=Chitinophaga pinensis (strain ATCC 43595 / DSM 2588 / LMG 13176 / NBRC 15968 / NCIMB 11800 / UQM 2034) TaxID=485918 RepID=A0A979G4T0_CHIPD|nr:hypothetical protein [Chitinophaga pinensis]ACU60713.1 hypothetical protein Cpin_3246 [Chitinophaga pinensis DSM 2588]